MQHWNRNRVYSSITPMLAMLHWRQHHIVDQALHFTVSMSKGTTGCACVLRIAELTFFQHYDFQHRFLHYASSFGCQFNSLTSPWIFFLLLGSNSGVDKSCAWLADCAHQAFTSKNLAFQQRSHLSIAATACLANKCYQWLE